MQHPVAVIMPRWRKPSCTETPPGYSMNLAQRHLAEARKCTAEAGETIRIPWRSRHSLRRTTSNGPCAHPQHVQTLRCHPPPAARRFHTARHVRNYGAQLPQKPHAFMEWRFDSHGNVLHQQRRKREDTQAASSNRSFQRQLNNWELC